VKLDQARKRYDIQALRGYAVLLVLLFHSGVDALRSGFLGVDIFFVISGFLITGLIVRGLDGGTFSVGHFYFRRAKRLLPAAYITLIATAALAPYFLTASQIPPFHQQIIGAVTFTANLVLWKQSGYFDAAATAKPLLHFWSLAVEEQYYLVTPLVLVLTPARWRF
jgi:peptidoglycan/LPS O-acetylase OafA/YrhL